MDAKRGLALLMAGTVMTPLALGLGVVFLVAAVDDGEESGLAGAGTLKVGPGAVPAKYADLIQAAADSCDAGLPAAVLAAQLMQESGFQADPGPSSAGALGIAQFMPGTWASAGVDGNGDGRKDPLDPEDAIPAQGRMMCKLLRSAKKHPDYNGSPVELALAGYNAGWGRVEQYRGVPPKSFAGGETYSYVEIIMANVTKLTGDGDRSGSAGGWSLPTDGALGTGYHQRGGMWFSGYHTGIDFVVPTGSSVKAVGPGTVVSAGWASSYGKEVVIRHPDGMYSQYAHLAQVEMKAGQTVKAGRRIGLSGSTGNSSGPHLHLEIRTTPKYGSDVNPVTYLRKRGLSI